MPTLRDQDLGLNFYQRTSSVTQETMKLTLRLPGLAFCDIARDRDGGAPELRSKIVELPPGKLIGTVVNEID